MKNIAAAFVKAKGAFGPALKDKTNPAFRSKYADLGACIDSVEDALQANGIAFYQETFEDQTGVTVETVFLHESGEALRCGKLHVPAAKQDPQGYGSALTYARRYSLMTACGIAPEDDDGNAATKNKTNAKGIPVGPGGMSGKDVTKEAFDKLAPDWQAFIADFAVLVENTFDQQGISAAKEMIADKWAADDLDNDHRVALEFKLPANVRSALKK